MVSCLTVPPLPANQAANLATTRPGWDIFCKVVDNFGDMAVCWRLASQLAVENGLRVRLWVDDLESFKLLCPQVDPWLSIQDLQGIALCHWQASFPVVVPARVVLETFACRIPDSFVESMARQSPPPVWINLDYLSAECWVPSWHGLPSPHPRLPLVKYFFFPGFTSKTGGLLREKDLRARRARFTSSADLQSALWHTVGFAPPLDAPLLISLFAYENAAIMDLLYAWEVSDSPVCCIAPLSRMLPALAAYCGRTLQAGDSVRRGALEIRVLPFLKQQLYDELLWLCDLNFVRGEDSFVRAQWAARPLVWQIYPQQEAAHMAKLDAFLALYCADLMAAARIVVHEFWHAWNTKTMTTAHWRSLVAILDALSENALRWDEELARDDDLCTRLVRFSRSKL